MRLSENGDYSDNSWIDYQETYAFTLSSGDGEKTVYVWFKDGVDKISSRYESTIVLDTSSPSILSHTPAADATGVSPADPIEVQFDQQVDPATLSVQTAYIKKNGASSAVPASISYSSTLKKMIIAPSSLLEWNTPYTVSITTGIKDSAGNSLSLAANWSFTTKVKEASLTLKGTVKISDIHPPNQPGVNGDRFRYAALLGNYLYATAEYSSGSTSNLGLVVKVDISNPDSSFTVVQTKETGKSPWMIAAQGSYLYIGHESDPLYKLDTTLTTVQYGPSSTDYYGGLITLAGSNKDEIAQITSRYLNSYWAASISSSGHELDYQTGNFRGDPGDTEAMLTIGNWTYLGETKQGMSNTNSIEVIYTGGIGTQGATTVTALLDITSSTTDSDKITGLASDSGEMLYVTHSGDDTKGIVVVDTNDPSDEYAVLVQTTATGNLNSVTGSEDISIGEYATGETYAVVARGSYGLCVLDLTDMYHPTVLLYSMPITGTGAYRVLFDGKYVHVLTSPNTSNPYLNLDKLSVYELTIQ